MRTMTLLLAAVMAVAFLLDTAEAEGCDATACAESCKEMHCDSGECSGLEGKVECHCSLCKAGWFKKALGIAVKLIG